MTLAALWLVIALAGGALGTFVLLHYAVDVREVAPGVPVLERELAWSRLRLITALVAGYVTDALLGLAALGWQFNQVLWYALFFAKAFYWIYVIYKSVKMRLMFEDVRIGDGHDHVTGV
jgi:hypothetical protein